MNQYVIGLLRGLGMVVLTAVLNYLANAANLQGIVSPTIASLISVVVLAIEHGVSAPGTALFGAVRSR